jgi:LysM repeat protein
MMKHLLSLLLAVLSTALMAQSSKTKPTSGPTVVLSSKDTLYLTIEEGKKIIHHRAKPKQTLFSLARFYCLGLDELYEYNPRYRTDPSLKVGQLVSIPTPNIAIKRYKRKGFKSAQHTPVYYVVQPGDNLYQISKRSFDMPVDSVRVRNKLKSDNLVPGQLLHIGWISTEGFQPSWRTEKKSDPVEVLAGNFEEQKNQYKEMISQGICTWTNDQTDEHDFYALHREAAIGSILAVTNPANRKTVHAKVIGRIPPNFSKRIEVVLSLGAAQKISATEAEFLTKLKYFY